MLKVHEKIEASEYSFRYSDKNQEEINCLFGLVIFRELYQDS